MSLILAICGIFALGALGAWAIARYGKAQEEKGRAQGDLNVAQRKQQDTTDVMQRQDELAAIAARRDDPDDVPKRLRNGSF